MSEVRPGDSECANDGKSLGHSERIVGNSEGNGEGRSVLGPDDGDSECTNVGRSLGSAEGSAEVLPVLSV